MAEWSITAALNGKCEIICRFYILNILKERQISKSLFVSIVFHSKAKLTLFSNMLNQKYTPVSILFTSHFRILFQKRWQLKQLLRVYIQTI